MTNDLFSVHEYIKYIEKRIAESLAVPAWMLSGKMPQKKPVCDCGAEKAKTTHSDWCSIKGEGK